MLKASPKSTRSGNISEEILGTALRLFCEYGYFNTSIHDIQRASGVSMGSIYNYFGGKGSIAKALYNKLLEQMEAAVDRAVGQHVTAHDRARAMVETLFELTESDPDTVGFILNARHHEFLPDEPAICSSQAFVKLRDIVVCGMRNGEIRSLDPWVASSLVFGPALRMVVLRLDGLIEQPLPGQLEPLWDLTWQSVRQPAL
jgi:TetR/AcrR family transcriptional regulator, repressor of fatR-cypB operon